MLSWMQSSTLVWFSLSVWLLAACQGSGAGTTQRPNHPGGTAPESAWFTEISEEAGLVFQHHAGRSGHEQTFSRIKGGYYYLLVEGNDPILR